MEHTLDEMLIQVTGVSQSYGGKQVLSGIDLTIRNLHVAGRVAGQVVALVGPSGCGKTQTMRIIAGLQTPTTGTVLIGNTPTHRGLCGFVFQKYPLFIHRTVLSNLQVAGLQAGLTSAETNTKASEYLEMFRLSQHSGKFPAELSGGMQQRVAIAQQLISLDGKPSGANIRVMMLDEPFSALDYANTRKTAAMLRNVADMDDNNTLIITTHDLRTALCLADLIVLMGFNVSGAGTIIRTWDLVEAGLTWNPDVEEQPRFREIERELFEELKK